MFVCFFNLGRCQTGSAPAFFLVFFKFPVNHKLPSPTAAWQIDVPLSFMAHTSDDTGHGGTWGSEHHPHDVLR